MDADLRPILSALRYRGEAVPEWHLTKWLSQFPPELRPTCMQIVRQIAARYYIGDELFYKATTGLVARAGVERQSIVSFCIWEHMGKGSQRVAHVLKNTAQWKLGNEIDLRHDLSTAMAGWHQLPSSIVMADDFVGSGKSLERLFTKAPYRVAQLLEILPQVKIKILLIAGFDQGIERVQNAILKSRLEDSVEVIPHIVYSNSDRCSHGSSIIIPDALKRREFIRFCLESGKQNGIHFPLGFGEVAAASVFQDTVPNNSLPLLWHDLGSWYPLFPASRTISSYLASRA